MSGNSAGLHHHARAGASIDPSPRGSGWTPFECRLVGNDTGAGWCDGDLERPSTRTLEEAERAAQKEELARRHVERDPEPSGFVAEWPVAKCADLEPPSRDTEYDAYLDRDASIIRIYFTVDSVNREYAIAYETDTTCREDPRFRAIIEHVLEEAPG